MWDTKAASVHAQFRTCVTLFRPRLERRTVDASAYSGGDIMTYREQRGEAKAKVCALIRSARQAQRRTDSQEALRLAAHRDPLL